MTTWNLVEEELAKWEHDRLPARLWLRDDDAVEPTNLLKQLVDMTAQFDVPVTIAVIPKLATEALAACVAKQSHVRVALHGYSHTNYAPPEQKKCELGMHRGKKTVLDELAKGHATLEQIFKKQFTNILVPPWNRIDALLVPELSTLGVTGLSTYGWERFFANANLAQHNTHVDIIDWKGTRGGRPLKTLIEELIINLKISRQHGGAPVGILSHHLVHDAAAWEFLQQLFQFSHHREDIKWCHAVSLPGVSTG